LPKYDFRCNDCGIHFELTRPFSQSSEPATCPRDGADATQLFSPPMDLLVYNREPLVSMGRVTIPPGALSCHDHGSPPGAHNEEHEGSASDWHARGYADSEHSGHGESEHEVRHGHSHSHAGGHEHGHSHGHGHGHEHGHSHPH
jgi:putative FmdB family regulatory protein